MVAPGLPAQLFYGFLLGWSVAWPPGPINAEMVRRTLAQGFRAGCALLFGACSGDALWAAMAVLGAGLVPRSGAFHIGLALFSTSLLTFLGVQFLRRAGRAYGDRRRGIAAHAPGRDGGRTAYGLGFVMALGSPWNVAFWLAVMGRAELAGTRPPAALMIALAVLAGAATWGVILSSIVAILRRQAGGPAWEIGANAATGLLMLYFAGREIWTLATG